MTADLPDRFYLARHGVTVANLGRARAARENEPLLPLGREQARSLAEEVRGLGVATIWTSPLDRARETADIIATACDLPMSVTAGLREIGSGRWIDLGSEEQVQETGVRVTGSSIEVDLEDLATTEEDMDSATERVRTTLERILSRGEPFLGITHLGPLRIARILWGDEPWETFGDFWPGNCQLVRFHRTDDRWEVVME